MTQRNVVFENRTYFQFPDVGWINQM